MIKKLLLFSTTLMLFVGVRSQSAESTNVQLGPLSAPAFTIKIEKEERVVQPFNLLFRQQAAVSLLRLRIARTGSNGILTVLPSASPLGLSLGPD